MNTQKSLKLCEHHIDTQEISDFGMFQILNFQIEMFDLLLKSSWPGKMCNRKEKAEDILNMHALTMMGLVLEEIF